MSPNAKKKNAELINKFYSSFNERNAASMLACYRPDVAFTDPTFGTLKGDRARAMWSMLCARAVDLVVEHDHVKADDTSGSAWWYATYKYGTTHHEVRNFVQAKFEFSDGLISKHTDDFDLHHWAAQALGTSGLLLGGFGPFQRILRRKANAKLDAFIENPKSDQ